MNLYVPQPAYKIYAFDRGWRIMNYVTSHLFQRTDKQARWWFGKAQNVILWASSKEWYAKYAAYVVVGGLWLAGGSQYISAMIIAALFLALQAVLLSIWAAFSAIFMGLLSAYNVIYSRIYGIFYRCPDCHKDMPIPTYICSACHTEHTRLWPSIYGVLSHRCTGCETKLYTMGAGRKKLERICPHCRRPLNAGVGTGTNLHIPIVGGPSTGKTNYIVMATRALLESYQAARYAITFTDPYHQRTFEENVQRLDQGRVLVKTTEVVPQAYNLSIKAPRALVPSIAYVYDAAGEAFEDSKNTDSQVYYKYIDGLIFIIDPSAIPAYHSIHQGEIALIDKQLRPGTLDVMQTYERMVEMFASSVHFQKGRRYTHPIAVVVTKTDALNLESEIGAPAAQLLMQHTPTITSEADAIHTLVRDFLNSYGLDYFVRELELHFSNVRYFSCSALGRLPSFQDAISQDMSSFTPLRVGEPLFWLLSQTKAIKPLVQKAQVTQQLAPVTGQLETTPEAMQQQQYQ